MENIVLLELKRARNEYPGDIKNCCTYSQQVSEKALKALFLINASELDPHYVETRYPGAIGGTQAPYKYYDKKEAKKALKIPGGYLNG